MTPAHPRGLLLISGGIDSPVAGHLMQSQGLPLGAIHFSLEPFTDDAAEQKCRRAATVLGIPEIVVVPAGPLFAEIPKRCDHKLYFVLSKRLMIRIAEAYAREHGYDMLVTGENLGQVSSQTLPNLVAITTPAHLPVVRPLIAYDKSEIVDLAREIGTFDLSKGPEICDVLGPKFPATTSTVEEVDAEEAKLPLDDMIRKALEGLRAAPALAA
ncbi:MAG TPA: hypothetical protein VNZ52_12240 [Candidatus Thermoplasmatota archaeon]|nr:hypothetical protein [Candidatus Thermoplasmatota archaeon]